MKLINYLQAGLLLSVTLSSAAEPQALISAIDAATAVMPKMTSARVIETYRCPGCYAIKIFGTKVQTNAGITVSPWAIVKTSLILGGSSSNKWKAEVIETGTSQDF